MVEPAADVVWFLPEIALITHLYLKYILPDSLNVIVTSSSPDGAEWDVTAPSIAALDVELQLYELTVLWCTILLAI